MLTYFPKYFTDKAIVLYFVVLSVVSVIFYNYAMSWYWFVFGAVEVVGFFYFANLLSKKWSVCSSKAFNKKLFKTALIIRILYVVFSYFFYILMTGRPFEFSAADTEFYNEMGRYGHVLIGQGNFNFLYEFNKYAGGLNYSDSGYPIYLSFIYFLTNDSVFLTRIIKAVLSAYTCVLIYKLAVRNFGESTGRMAALFCMLMPNIIYYCGLHLKETEMVFLTVLFIERMDSVLRNTKLSVVHFILFAIIGISLFFFRNVLGIVVFLSITATMVLSSSRIMGWGKKLLLSLVLLLTIGVALSDRILMEVNETFEGRKTNQQISLQWRAEREGGNSLAKYASKSIFAPLIFTIPFPTMVDLDEQYNQQLIHGGNYVKNITSAFTIFALLSLLLSGEWRKHVLPASFLCSYLLVIALSAFAHSERFHLPALPFALMFAAYGVSLLENKHKRWYNIWLIGIFIAVVGWNWFKLKGRSLL